MKQTPLPPYLPHFGPCLPPPCHPSSSPPSFSSPRFFRSLPLRLPRPLVAPPLSRLCACLRTCPLSSLPSWIFLFAFLWPCLSLVFTSLPPSPSSLFSSLPTCCPFCLPPHLSFALPAYLLVSFLGFLIGLFLTLPFPCLCLTPALAVLSLFLSPYLPSISPPSPSAVFLTCLPPFLLA